LINGAGGGVGPFAVQIAKYFGAEVTGVDNSKKFDMLRSIGADYVIDYTQEDFTKNGQHYDLILDIAGYHMIFDYRRALSSNANLFFSWGFQIYNFPNFVYRSINFIGGSKKMSLMAWKPNNKEDLDFIKELIESGKLVPVIDRCYPLNEVAEAFRYFEEGHPQGKNCDNCGT